MFNGIVHKNEICLMGLSMKWTIHSEYPCLWKPPYVVILLHQPLGWDEHPNRAANPIHETSIPIFVPHRRAASPRLGNFYIPQKNDVPSLKHQLERIFQNFPTFSDGLSQWAFPISQLYTINQLGHSSQPSINHYQPSINHPLTIILHQSIIDHPITTIIHQ